MTTSNKLDDAAREMSDTELAALIALANRATAEFNGRVQQFGERPWDAYAEPSYQALWAELVRRGILK